VARWPGGGELASIDEPEVEITWMTGK